MGSGTLKTLVIGLIVGQVVAYPTGPPVANTTVCDSMFPAGHGVAAQTDTPPVKIKLNTEKCYKENMELEVEVEHTSGGNLKGIFVQVRKSSTVIPNTDTSNPYGTFKSAGDSQPMKAYACNNTDDAWGHSNRLSAGELKFKWSAPSASVGDLRIVLTAVENKTTFWTFVQSDTISFNADCESTDGMSMMSFNLGLLMLPILAAMWRQ